MGRSSNISTRPLGFVCIVLTCLSACKQQPTNGVISSNSLIKKDTTSTDLSTGNTTSNTSSASSTSNEPSSTDTLNNTFSYITLSQRTKWEVSHTVIISQMGTNAFQKLVTFMLVPKTATLYQDGFSLAATSELTSGIKPLEISVFPFGMTAWVFDGLGKLTGDSGQSGNSIARNIVYYTTTSSILVEPSGLNQLLLSDYTKSEEEDLYLNHFNNYFDKDSTAVQETKQKIIQILTSSNQEKRPEVLINLVTEAFKFFVGAGIKVADRVYPEENCAAQPGNDSQVLEGNCGTQLEVANTFCSLVAALGIPCRPVLGFYAGGITLAGQGVALRAWVEVLFPKHPWLPINIVEAILHSSSPLDKTYLFNLPFDFVGVVRGLYWEEFNGVDSLPVVATGGSSVVTTGFVPQTQRNVVIKKFDTSLIPGSAVRSN